MSETNWPIGRQQGIMGSGSVQEEYSPIQLNANALHYAIKAAAVAHCAGTPEDIVKMARLFAAFLKGETP